jgi:phosphate transport system substrate-binding protein
MKKINFLITLFCSVTFLLVSCGEKKDEKKSNADDPTKGEITIAVDESFAPILEAEVSAFMQSYKGTKINIASKPEAEAIGMMLNGKARFATVARELTNDEKEIFKQEDIQYRSFKFAADGLALIINKENRDTLIKMSDLKDLMTGKKSKWSEIGGKMSGKVTLVFDNPNSSNLRFLMDRFNLDRKVKVPFFALKNNKEVIEYVKTHKDAMGVIGVNWISDGEDASALNFIRSIRVMAVAEVENPSKDDYYEPFGYNIALKKYPLRREIKIILKEAHWGLGTGFINYMTGDNGQLIVLKSGLIPMTRQIQIRQVKTDNQAL